MRKIQVDLWFWLNFWIWTLSTDKLPSLAVSLHSLYSIIGISLSTVISNWPNWNPFVVITTESKNILLRHIYQRADEKVGDQFFMLHTLTNKHTHPYISTRTLTKRDHLSHLQLRPKRAASEHLLPEHGCKQLKASVQDASYWTSLAVCFLSTIPINVNPSVMLNMWVLVVNRKSIFLLVVVKCLVRQCIFCV